MIFHGELLLLVITKWYVTGVVPCLLVLFPFAMMIHESRACSALKPQQGNGWAQATQAVQDTTDQQNLTWGWLTCHNSPEIHLI